MTPREPDRFDKIARDITRQWDDVGTTGIEDILAAALRAAEASALERAAQECDDIAEESPPHSETRRIQASNCAHRIRALASPAAAPAADKARCQCNIGAVAASCVYATPDRPCECACHAPPSAPAPLLPRVLRALETWGFAALAAELRAYIATANGEGR